MNHESEPKRGRPPGLRVGKNRQIRLTDQQWQVFREKLGIKWLREQIAKFEPK